MWREDPISLAKKIAFRTRIPHVCCLCVFVNSAHRPLGLRCDPCDQRLTVVADTKLLDLAWAWGFSAKDEFQHSHTSLVLGKCQLPMYVPRSQEARMLPESWMGHEIFHESVPSDLYKALVLPRIVFFSSASSFSFLDRKELIFGFIYIEPWIRWYKT